MTSFKWITMPETSWTSFVTKTFPSSIVPFHVLRNMSEEATEFADEHLAGLVRVVVHGWLGTCCIGA
jgi:hypothetical protein